MYLNVTMINEIANRSVICLIEIPPARKKVQSTIKDPVRLPLMHEHNK
jgi:hypothetical protein